MRGGSARGFPAGRGSGRAAAPARRPSGHRARRRRGTAVVRAWSARVFQTAGQVVRRACPASDPSTAPECSLMSSAIEESLRSEVRMLGAVLGDTLRAHEGEPLFDLVEQVRARTKSLRLSPGQPDDAELAALLERVRTDVEILWHTDEVRSARLRVTDEIQNAVFYLERVLFDALPDVAGELAEALGRHYPQVELPPRPQLRLGSWVGGDQDGNPF